jgi:hypothetical protein
MAPEPNMERKLTIDLFVGVAPDPVLLIAIFAGEQKIGLIM